MVFGCWNTAAARLGVWCSDERWVFVWNFSVTRASVLEEEEGTNMTLVSFVTYS
jgi:hypothetical protein